MSNKVKFPTLSSFLVASCIYVTIILILFIKLTFFVEPPKKYTDDKDAIMDVVMVDREVDQTIKAPKQADEVVKETKPEPKKESEEDKQETTNKPVVPDEPLPTPSLPTPPKEEPKPEPKPEIPKPSEESKEDVKPEPKPEPKPTPKPVEKPKPKEPNIKDLFSDIDPTKLKKDDGIKKVENKVQSRKKSEASSSKAAKEASDIIKSLKIDQNPTAPKSQSTGTYDPLMGAITKQIQRRWQSYKADSANLAKVKVMIDQSGNFSYEILELSYNEEFNAKVKECLEKLTTEKFPFNPDKSTTFNLNLEDKIN
ncbi:TonB C-terminal domain-containing protein [Campylobacter concisus]|uniref:TonB C-terminal domain-containing protein n=1 Tax=Campylobacter concisus TaxID=199 RepID=UPI000CD7F638|nr:TonB C-terminal domain-containing protein [Campylobacter concisus]